MHSTFNMALWLSVLIVFVLRTAKAQQGTSFSGYVPPNYGSVSGSSGSAGGSGSMQMSFVSNYGGGSMGSSQQSSGYQGGSSGGYSGSLMTNTYGYNNNNNNNNYYTYPPVAATTTPTMPMMNVTCPGNAPIGCRFVPLIDPLSGNLVFCLLICDQPVTTTPTPPTNPTLPTVTASPATTTTTVSTTTIDPREAQIEACISAGLRPDPGCSFNGNGNPAPALTCGETCIVGPFDTCDPNAGTIIDRCLCQNGQPTPPSNGCTYTFRGMLSPLTCAQLCVAGPFG